MTMYTGSLAPFRRSDVTYVPHVSLGLFVKEAVRYDMSAKPRPSDLDEPRYRQARKEADAAAIDLRCEVATLELVEIGDEVIAWARGARPDFPSNEQARTRSRLDLAPPA